MYQAPSWGSGDGEASSPAASGAARKIGCSIYMYSTYFWVCRFSPTTAQRKTKNILEAMLI
jgi:hypothetical protein